jgi:Tfp pilus assembly protein PilV
MLVRPRFVRSKPPRRGITLIEVLAAMAIFMIALAAISQLIDSGNDMAVEASRVNTGTRLAQSKLAEVEAGVIPVRDGGSGTFDVETGWSWEVVSEPSDAPNVYMVNVIVRSTVGREVKVGLTQMIFDPQYQGNASEAQPPTDPGASQ